MGVKAAGRWIFRNGTVNQGSVEKFYLQCEDDDGQHKLDVAVVNIFKGTISPSTDIYGDGFCLERLFDKGPPVELTLHNALCFGNREVNC